MSQQRTEPLKLYGRPAGNRAAQFRNGRVPVAVYGLGKMGLPLAAVYAETTGNVTGVDIDPAVVASIEGGECPVENEPGLPPLTARLVDEGALRATTDGRKAAQDASVHVIIVPTEVDDHGSVDLRALESAVETVASGLEAGDMVVVESTVPPRTTSDVVAPTLASESGLDPDEFGVAFCPERTASGRALEDVRGAYPKVVGGVDHQSTDVARVLYEAVTANDVVPVTDATTAESVKVFEGVYRDVNIALANELATLADELGVDVREAIGVANGQPFCDIHDPGPGVGGHCIPYYPYFLISECETSTPLLETARGVNDDMAAVTVDRLADVLTSVDTDITDARIALLGVAYRPGVDETRAAPARRIDSILRDCGATTAAVDPVVSDYSEVGTEQLTLEELPDTEFDAAILVTDHDAFADIEWAEIATVVVDTRAAIDATETDVHLYTFGAGRRASSQD